MTPFGQPRQGCLGASWGRGAVPKQHVLSVVTSPHTYDVFLSNACATMGLCV